MQVSYIVCKFFASFVDSWQVLYKLRTGFAHRLEVFYKFHASFVYNLQVLNKFRASFVYSLQVLYKLLASPTASSWPRPPHYQGFTISLRHTTIGRTPLLK
jgi:hypothetical protein